MGGPGLTAQAWFEWKVLDKTCKSVNSVKSQSPYKPFLCRTNLMMGSCTMVICLVAVTILSGAGAEALESHSLSHNGNIKELENVRYQREASPVGGYDKIPKAKGKKAKKVKKEKKRNSKRKSRKKKKKGGGKKKKKKKKKKGGKRRIKERSSKKGARQRNRGRRIRKKGGRKRKRKGTRRKKERRARKKEEKTRQKGRG